MKNIFGLRFSNWETDSPLRLLFDLEVAMERLESSLKKVPLSTMSLGMCLDDLESEWRKVIKLYDRLTQDEQAEVKPIASGELQALYEDLHG